MVVKDKGGKSLAAYSLYIHDTTDGGSGAAEGCLDNLVAVARNALKIMESCDCKHGCPKCLTEYRCPQGNKTILKFSAAFLTSRLIQALESGELMS
ncbi:MAG: DUF1998 domain-containing protein [Synechococcales cyanobacterium CRU_2_2]|nr:DUF1998 domain-containing protein [Synechococcales cyanobacterium CRU_2_2]